jgi:hypothetical protein
VRSPSASEPVLNFQVTTRRLNATGCLTACPLGTPSPWVPVAHHRARPAAAIGILPPITLPYTVMLGLKLGSTARTHFAHRPARSEAGHHFPSSTSSTPYLVHSSRQRVIKARWRARSSCRRRSFHHQAGYVMAVKLGKHLRWATWLYLPAPACLRPLWHARTGRLPNVARPEPALTSSARCSRGKKPRT